ncbi:MAG: aminotransferase class I/II-fold pyridoxal phosphate-dependent enzyme, partial [Nitrospinae bacterium]|nr:aminotransferase class I/II-fold pyridoxal phosphate-dependent enzyme [Nitrospinota bacterium]
EMQVQKHVDIIIGTLGKSLASMGAYVVSDSPILIDYLINRAGEFIYSTFLSPSQVGSAEAAVKVLQSSQTNRESLHKVSTHFRNILGSTEIQGPSSPIIPVLIGDPVKTLELKYSLLQKGVLVGAVRPPTVPIDTSRLRISLHTGVTQEALNEVVEILEPWIKP